MQVYPHLIFGIYNFVIIQENSISYYFYNFSLEISLASQMERKVLRGCVPRLSSFFYSFQMGWLLSSSFIPFFFFLGLKYQLRSTK